MQQGGMSQVRFQPRVGQLLAAAAENVVNIFDIETNRLMFSLQVLLELFVFWCYSNVLCLKHCIVSLQEHTKEVHCVCWDANGEYLASVSHDSVRVWSLTSERESIHELSSNGNKFQCCVFHPSYPNLLVVGGYQVIYLQLQFL